MDLTCADKRRCRGNMAARTVHCGRRRCHVLFYLDAVVMVVAVEIGGMAGGAGSSIAAVDRSITVAVDSDNPSTVDA